MQVSPLNNMLKKHLLAVYLSALIQDREAALQFFESQRMTVDLVKELINLQQQFKHTYEIRLFIIGLSELLQCSLIPQTLAPLLLSLIQAVIDMNIKLKETE